MRVSFLLKKYFLMIIQISNREFIPLLDKYPRKQPGVFVYQYHKVVSGSWGGLKSWTSERRCWKASLLALHLVHLILTSS